MNAVVVGASGLVGRILLKQLLSHERFDKVISISRKPLNVSDKKLEQMEVADFSNDPSGLSKIPLSEPMREYFRKAHFFCCLGTTIKKAGSQDHFKKVDFEAVLEFAKLAHSYQALSLVVISATGASARSRIFYNRIKGEMEQALQSLGLKKLVMFRPSLLLGQREENRTGEKIFTNLIRTLGPVLPQALQRRLATSAELLAHRMIIESLDERSGNFIVEAVDIHD